MSKRPRPQVSDYTVGWICALPVELAAAEAMLDDLHDAIPQDVDDTNLYTLGRIGTHNVVIASLPAGHMGTNPAATLATNMKAKFTSVKIRLMVGIGGGVPRDESDVRLGDVVISQPQNQHGGIVQYDFGKTGEGGRSIRTGFLNSPPPLLLSALARLRADQYCKPTNITKHLSVFDKNSCFSREQAGLDVLFSSMYEHTGGPDCSGCSTENVVERAVRKSQEPKMHYGTIASENQVMKDGITRDRLCAELGGILCFEMEAAGLMNSFPCLVIRGICDYADSHKNKAWQPYAAATAAACAKEILHILPTVGVVGTHIDHDPGSEANADEHRRYMESLKFDQIEARRENIKKQHLKTCQWLLSKSEYQDWRDVDKIPQHHGLLWIKGKPGTGKSTIMKFAHAAAKRNWKDAIVLSFFFNARGEGIEKSVEGMYRTLLLQLLENLPDLQFVFDVLGSKAPCDGETRTWNIEVLKDLLHRAIENLGERTVSCFIDALDECEEDQVRDMVIFFEDLGEIAVSSQIRLYTCFSSRHYPHISVSNSVQLVLEGQEGHAQDMKSYLHYELKAGRSKHIQDIKTEILERARGIFLWVVLVVPILNREYDRGRIHALRKRLDEIPDGLDELFKDILTRDSQNLDELILCVQWILYARRPLKREELYYAILAGLEPDSVTPWNPEEITKDDIDRFILSSSKGLAEVTRSKGQTVQFIHESVRDFLLQGNGLSRLQPRLETNFLGLSHDRLKICCQLYTQIDLSGDLLLDKEMPNAPTTEAAELRQLSSRKFPFLEYAVRNVLEHADSAEARGVSQVEFVNTFALEDWIVRDNLLERYQIRRHTSGASMLYIFAERNLPNLIRIELERVRHMDIPGERYGYPIMAALANGHEKAIRALLTPSRRENDANYDRDLLCTTEEREEAIARLLEIRISLVKELTRASMTLVQYLSIKGNANVPLKALLSTGKTSHSLQQIFAWAQEECRLDAIESWLVAGMNPPSLCHDTLLYQASERGYQHVVQYLIRKGANINHSGALYAASKHGQHQIVALLLEAGAVVDVDRRDLQSGNSSALYAASRHGHEQIVRLLLRSGANVDLYNGAYQSTALCTSAGHGHLEIVRLLLDHGAKVDALLRRVQGNESALYVASEMGYEQVVRLLLKNGAKVDLYNGMEQITALFISAAHGHLEIVRLLLDHGANINLSSGYFGNGYSGGPLTAASGGGHKAIVELLLARGADIDKVHRSAGSALVVASRNGRNEIVELLLTAGADVNISGRHFNSPLLMASLKGDEEVVELLLREGADPSARDFAYGSALDASLSREYEHIVKQLIDAGAHISDVNRQTLLTHSRKAGRAYGGYQATALNRDSTPEINHGSGVA